MTDREMANTLLNYGIALGADGMTYQQAYNYTMRDIAAIREECADRAVKWAKKWAEFPMGNHGTEALHAAIMGDE